MSKKQQETRKQPQERAPDSQERMLKEIYGEHRQTRVDEKGTRLPPRIRGSRVRI